MRSVTLAAAPRSHSPWTNYRESVDIDFLCASQEEYRRLREAVSDRGLSGLTREGTTLKTSRDMQSDQYGIRTFLDVEGMPIKLEIVREARIGLSGSMNADYGVPILARDDMYAEKLLANDDRWRDASVMSRDIIDLSMMISRWGPISEGAWAKAEDAYGKSVRLSYTKAVDWIRDPDRLTVSMKAMQMDLGLGDESEPFMARLEHVQD